MPHASPLATGLASAFLAGAWSVDELVERGRILFGRRHAWVRALARKVIRAFPSPPRAHRERLEVFLAASSELRASLHARRPPRLRCWLTDVPEMAESKWSVPALATIGDLATWLELEPAELDWLADLRGLGRHRPQASSLHHYRYRWIQKRTGGVRLLEAPKPKLARVQRRLLRGILDLVPPHDAAHGFRCGHSVKTFVEPHVARAFVLRCDLEGFFVSVRRTKVRAVFGALGYPIEVAATLAALCTHGAPASVFSTAPVSLPLWERRALTTPHLPQGAPSSPALANLSAWALDVRLSSLARTMGVRYTRYADDLAFSGDGALSRSARPLEILVGAIAIEEGFALNFRKTRAMPCGGRQSLAGVVVNARPGVRRIDRDRLEAILHNCVKRGPSSQNREGHPDFRAHLRGRVAWVSSINPHHGERMRKLFDAIHWE